MPIVFHGNSGEFHLYNDQISYIIEVLPNGQLGQLYFGKRLADRESYGYLREERARSLAAYVLDEDEAFSLQHTRQEYPSYGTTDFRYPAFVIRQENGSEISDFKYQNHYIFNGKKKLEGLPAVYVEKESEAQTLEIVLKDSLTQARLILNYTIFVEFPVITRSVRLVNDGDAPFLLRSVMSMCLDLPDSNFEMLTLSGSWARERYPKVRRLEQGIQGVYSMRGASSAEHNPFLALKRPETTEASGEVYGFSLVYSGNFLAQAEADTHGVTRVLLGIHPNLFEWKLQKGETFQSPEAVLVFSENGLNGMSQAFHKLYRTRLARGFWRDRTRPVLLNNWEATEFDFDEAKILGIARLGKKLGCELFVLDDGWFTRRNSDRAGLGDWEPDNGKLPEGITGLAEKIKDMGLAFGLWFEPEMVNKDSNLYRAHPEWVLHTPGRHASASRHQYTLDLTRGEVREYLYQKISGILNAAPVSYVKWDMNRYMTECYSTAAENRCQGEVMHRYILGLYSLYEKLTAEFPEVLFESCASGGARFDPGMLYYAPQAWTSDDTDAYARLKIQYGTSYVYPVSCMGAHVSAVPNQQVGRITPLETRFQAAMYGAFGYELDFHTLSRKELDQVRRQIAFVKQYRNLIRDGLFFRLRSPFEDRFTAWMAVSENRREAVASCFRIWDEANDGFGRLKLQGLSEERIYSVFLLTSSGEEQEVGTFGGAELMYAGLGLFTLFEGKTGDFQTVTLVLRGIEE